jgi:hypothetical protein
VIVGKELPQVAAKRSFIPDDYVIQALAPDSTR